MQQNSACYLAQPDPSSAALWRLSIACDLHNTSISHDQPYSWHGNYYSKQRDSASQESGRPQRTCYYHSVTPGDLHQGSLNGGNDFAKRRIQHSPICPSEPSGHDNNRLHPRKRARLFSLPVRTLLHRSLTAVVLRLT